MIDSKPDIDIMKKSQKCSSYTTCIQDSETFIRNVKLVCEPFEWISICQFSFVFRELPCLREHLFSGNGAYFLNFGAHSCLELRRRHCPWELHNLNSDKTTRWTLPGCCLISCICTVPQHHPLSMSSALQGLRNTRGKLPGKSPSDDLTVMVCTSRIKLLSPNFNKMWLRRSTCLSEVDRQSSVERMAAQILWIQSAISHRSTQSLGDCEKSRSRRKRSFRRLNVFVWKRWYSDCLVLGSNGLRWRGG